MIELIKAGLAMGWPALGLLVALLFYFKFSISDPVANKRAVFKTFIGILAAFLLFMAIANYKMNFFAESRLLPVSLVLITCTAFMMALYFTNLSALLRIGGFMFFIARPFLVMAIGCRRSREGFLPLKRRKISATCRKQNLLTKARKLFSAGLDKIKFRVPSVRGNVLCAMPSIKGCWESGHQTSMVFLSGLEPNIGDARYHKGNPAARDSNQKEAFPGSGTAENAQEYIAESHSCPSCFVVAGYGVKGTNDKESPMPAIHKPPISLSLPELAAVDTWLYVREGREAPSFDEIVKSYEKFIPESDRPKPPTEGDAKPGASALMADGTEPVDQIFAKGQCVACHTIPGIAGATGTIGPKLVEGTNAPLRIKDKEYKGKAKSVSDYIMESIVEPSAYVVKGFPDNTMPKVFGQKLSAGALKKIVDYLSQVQEGKEPPKTS